MGKINIEIFNSKMGAFCALLLTVSMLICKTFGLNISYWLVFAPIWIPAIFVLFVLLVIFLMIILLDK